MSKVWIRSIRVVLILGVLSSEGEAETVQMATADSSVCKVSGGFGGSIVIEQESGPWQCWPWILGKNLPVSVLKCAEIAATCGINGLKAYVGHDESGCQVPSFSDDPQYVLMHDIPGYGEDKRITSATCQFTLTDQNKCSSGGLQVKTRLEAFCNDPRWNQYFDPNGKNRKQLSDATHLCTPQW